MLIIKELAHNALLTLRPLRTFVQRWHSTGINNDAVAAQVPYAFFTESISPAGKDVLEIGPGQTMRVLQNALDAGARSATAVDIADYFADDRAALGGVRLEIYDGRTLPVPDASADLIWSYNAFEHVRWPALMVTECARVLRPGGALVCQVDLRDHYTSIEAKSADHLRYPDWLWKAMTWNRSAFTNRLRYSEWLALFARAGLTLRSTKPHVSDVLRAEHARRKDLQRFSSDDIAITSFRATLGRD